MIVSQTYGHKVDFKGTCLPRMEREMYLKHDKDDFVRFACRLRTKKGQIKGFCEYKNYPDDGLWLIDVRATQTYHKMLQEALKDPLPILQKWAEEDKARAEAANAEPDSKPAE